MNVIKYKNIDDLIRKKDIYLAQEIDNDELKLISKGYIPTKFNIGINDVLEFTLYDSNNNLLQQETFGNVRYVKGDKIKDYLLTSNNPNDQISEGGGFVVDIKRLIKEAGFNTGYFRVQINFVNNRVGSDYPKDKVWIQEISPSRLEMRLLPFNNFNETNLVEQDIKKDLNQSYDSFLLGKFSGDEVYQEIYTILDSIKATDIANIMSTVITSATRNKLIQEFNIVGGYDLFYARVLDDMKKAVVYELLYRDSIIGSQNFGKPISDTVRSKITQKDYNYYTKQEIILLLNNKFKESVKYHLPNRTLNETLRVNDDLKESLEALRQVVQTLQSDTKFQLPNINLEKIELPPPPPPPPAPTPPPPPPPIVIPLVFINGPTITVAEKSVQINYSTNLSAVTTINFEGGICPSDGCSVNYNDPTTDRRVLLSGLNSGTKYKFVVEAKTLDGKIVKSAPIDFETPQLVSRERVYDPYVPTEPVSSGEGGGGGGRVAFTYRDTDGNPDTIEASIGDITGLPIK